MAKNRWAVIAAIPVLTLLGGLMLALSVNASPALFGLYLSIAAWLFVIGLIVLPYLLLKLRKTAASPAAKGFSNMTVRGI